MFPFRREAANQTVADIEIVSRKLDAAQTDLAAAEQELREAALDAALADDAEAEVITAGVGEKVRHARERVDLLTEAMSVAQGRQRQRQIQAAAAAEKTRIRSIAQQAGRGGASGAAIQIDEGLDRVLNGWRDLLRAAGRVERLLKPGERVQMFGHGSTELMLFELVSLALHRANARIAPGFRFPGVSPQTASSFGGLLTLGQNLRDAPPLETLVRQRLTLTSATIVDAERVPAPAAAPQAPPPPVSEPAAAIEPAAEEAGDAVGELQRQIDQADAERALAGQLDIQVDPAAVAEIAEAYRVLDDPSSTPDEAAAARRLIAWRVPQKGGGR